VEGAAHEYCPKEKHVTVHDGQVVNKGETIVDGPADRTTSCVSGMEALAPTSSTRCRTSTASRA
jgi:DNA-directed RNA polymerase subunit beta'